MLEQEGSEQSTKHGAECSLRTQEESRVAREELNLDLEGGQVAGQTSRVGKSADEVKHESKGGGRMSKETKNQGAHG